MSSLHNYTWLAVIGRRGSFYLTSINIQYTYQTKECERLADIQDVSSRRGVGTGCHFCLFVWSTYTYIDVRTAAELQKGVSANRSAKTKNNANFKYEGDVRMVHVSEVPYRSTFSSDISRFFTDLKLKIIKRRHYPSPKQNRWDLHVIIIVSTTHPRFN